MLEFTMRYDDNLQADLYELIPSMDKAIYYGLSAVASELPHILQQHIRSDVYDAYTPKAYKRRVDNPDYGISIIDMRNIYSQAFLSSRHMVFSYYPTGANNQYPNLPYVSGDELIETLETGQGYAWGSANIPARPFWTEFVRDVIDQGIAERAFVAGFNTYSNDIKIAADGNVKRDGQETEF